LGKVEPARVPPHRIPKASRHLTLMARLLVLLNTTATIGNKSFLTVKKSEAEIMVGTVFKALSITPCIDEAKPLCTIGMTSTPC
jgi:hypothetical protein